MSMDIVRSGGFRRYLVSNTTQAAYSASLNKGKVLTAAQLAALTVFPIQRNLVAEIIFVGVGTATQAGTYRIWGLRSMAAQASATAPYTMDESGLLAFCLGEGTMTLGAGTGISGGTGVAGTGEKLCDQLTWTASGNATTVVGPQVALETALNEGTSGVSTATTPDGSAAMLVLPNLGRYNGIIIDIVKNASSTSANCLIATNEI